MNLNFDMYRTLPLYDKIITEIKVIDMLSVDELVLIISISRNKTVQKSAYDLQQVLFIFKKCVEVRHCVPSEFGKEGVT